MSNSGQYLYHSGDIEVNISFHSFLFLFRLLRVTKAPVVFAKMDIVFVPPYVKSSTIEVYFRYVLNLRGGGYSDYYEYSDIKEVRTVS